MCTDPKAAIMATWDECEEQFQKRMEARYERNCKVCVWGIVKYVCVFCFVVALKRRGVSGLSILT